MSPISPIFGSGKSEPAIGTDLLYKFYDNKAITPQIRAALQKRQDEEAKASQNEGSGNSNTNSSGPGPGPAARVNISEQIIRMNIANGTDKPEDLKSKVQSSKEVQEIEKRLAAEAEAKKKEEEAAAAKKKEEEGT